MNYVKLNNGSEMPMIGYGTWTLKGKQCETCVRTALEAGYRLIDTAQMYDNEQEVGRAIRLSGINRENIFVTTKISSACFTEAETLESIETSLRRLKMDHVDLLLLHEPFETDTLMYKAMETALRRGMTRSIGVSNYSAGEIEKLIRGAEIIPAVNQVESHVFHTRAGFAKYLKTQGIVMQSWAPFAEGKKDMFHQPLLREISGRYGRTVAQTALRFLLQNGIPVIPKTVQEGRMRENLGAGEFELDVTDMRLIAGLEEGRSLFGWDD